MNIKKTIITATVALTMVAMIAPIAGAATVPAQCVNVFTRNLRVGSTGTDVWCLQVALNASGYQVSATGAGSPGNETSYFGPKTLVAVRAWQAAQGWSPASQVGPLSRAKLNMWSTGSVVVTPPPVIPPVATGPVNALLAVDNPASGNIVSNSTTTAPGQAAADLLHVTFTGSGTVTSVTLKRSGISDQNTLSNVYVYDGNTRITDGYSFNVAGDITINGLSVLVSGSHTISIRGDVAANAAATASTIAVTLTGYTANGVATAANVVGNMMGIVIGNLASATITTAASSAVPSANVNAGTTAYTFWSAPLQINTRAVWLKMADFRMIGSAPSDALGNIRMFIDGVDTGKVATVMSINGSNYAVFDLTSNPISLATGSHTLDMRADIQKGTNRTIQVSIQQASDLMITDPQLGVNIPVSSTTAGSFSANNAGTITILTGSATIVIDPTFAAQTNVSGGSSNVVIAKFKIHAYGEDLKINSLQVNPYITSATSTGATCTTDGTTGAATGTCGLNNVTLYFNGSQVGPQKTFTQTTSTAENSTTVANELSVYSLGSQMIAPAGQDSWLEVRTDLQTTANVAYTGGTIKVTLPFLTSGANYLNAQGMNSQNTLSVPTAAVTTNGLTIQTGGLQVSKNTAYLNQNISPNTSGVKIGSYTIQNQSSSQSVRLTNLSIATTIATTTVSNFSALRTSDTTGSGSTPITFSGTQSGTTSTDTFSVTDVLAPGGSMILDIFANTGAATSGTIATTLTVSSIGVTDNIAATSSTITGQTLTLGTGTLGTPTLVPTVTATTPAQFILGGTTAGSKATFNFVSTSGASTITELAFTVTGSDATPTQTVTNVCVGTACQSPVTQTVGSTSTGVVKLTGLSLSVPNGGNGLDVPVTVSYSAVGTSGVTPSKTSTLGLGYAKYNTGSTSKTIGTSTLCTTLVGAACTDSISAVSANAMTMVGSLPVVTLAAGNSQSVNADSVVARVTVAANSTGGGVRIRTLVFNLAYAGYNTLPTGTSAESITDSSGNTISTFTCTAGSFSSGAVTETCTNSTATYATDYPVGTTAQEFDLHVTTSGAANTTGTPKVSTTLGKSTFLWDDTSTNGGSGSTALTGGSIYSFPTTSVNN